MTQTVHKKEQVSREKENLTETVQLRQWQIKRRCKHRLIPLRELKAPNTNYKTRRLNYCAALSLHKWKNQMNDVDIRRRVWWQGSKDIISL